MSLCVSGATSWNQSRMTVDELEKLQFIAAEKARQVLTVNCLNTQHSLCHSQ